MADGVFSWLVPFHALILCHVCSCILKILVLLYLSVNVDLAVNLTVLRCQDLTKYTFVCL